MALGATGTGKVLRLDVGGMEVEDETHSLRQGMAQLYCELL